MRLAHVDPGLAWSLFGFLFPASILVLAARHGGTTLPPADGVEHGFHDPDGLIVLTHFLAAAHFFCVVGAVIVWREWRGVVVVASVIQLVVTAWAWFIAQMALAGAWL